ncbi:L,D-transpeptidase family protein [soil metagenome]
MTHRVSVLHVRSLNARMSSGILVAGGMAVPCGLGHNGRTWRKVEGDGMTPRGSWPFRRMLRRPGKPDFANTALPTRVMRRADGWCDDPADRNYNRQITRPYPASHEALWRDDSIYDVVVILGHNERQRSRGKGSAVFFHIREGKGNTDGCVAISRADMRKILPFCSRHTILRVW